MNNSEKYKVILCDYINPLSDKKADLVRGGALAFIRGSDGHYVFHSLGTEKSVLKELGNKRSIEVIDKIGMLALPSFFDLHFHWVQDDVRLMAKENLMSWLENHTWPYEKKFKNKTYSKSRAKKFREELLEVGTLGGAVYSSIHEHTVDHALEQFLGDFTVGNVQMTMNSPKYLTMGEDESVDLARKLGAKYKKKYALTPRFAPTTHPKVMERSKKAINQHHCFIQTHLSETKNEIEYVLSLYKEFEDFKDVKTYTEIYEKVGLLTDRTIMGHGIYLSESELKILAKYKTAIAHCPTSNAPTSQHGLGSGLFDYKAAERFKLNWALGSDIGGGPYLSMIDVMNSFVKQNRKAGHKETSYTKALHRATLKGAELMKVDHKAGNFKQGKYASFVLLASPAKKAGENSEGVLEKIIKRCDENRDLYQKMVEETYYKGKLVFKKRG